MPYLCHGQSHCHVLFCFLVRALGLKIMILKEILNASPRGAMDDCK
jgi:hypothetical protein